MVMPIVEPFFHKSYSGRRAGVHLELGRCFVTAEAEVNTSCWQLGLMLEGDGGLDLTLGLGPCRVSLWLYIEPKHGSTDGREEG